MRGERGSNRDRSGNISDGFFHAMEKNFAVFPQYGKFLTFFSTLWKIFG